MNELATKYNPADVEGKWYAYWLEHKLFKSTPDGREPYTVVIPPPNVTGILHMGHMLNNTIQDILVRRARMEGKNACWVPGTDHASIATEAKVVNKLAAQGIKKSDLTREEFLKYAWEWKEEHGGIILKQLQKLGASCDWDRTAFTMDEIRSKSVIKVFVDLYNKGLIYRGVRMVNWDPKALTALSDEEVIYKDEHSKLYYLRYFIEGDDKYIIVATTRPETILGDTAVCVNPNDPRYSFLKGKKVIIPLVNRAVPIIMDEYVDMEFGTGCLKVTPAHDVNDYMLGEKYNLPSIDIFNDNGTISEAGGLYVGMDRFDVRKQIAIDLQEAGLLEKVKSMIIGGGQLPVRVEHWLADRGVNAYKTYGMTETCSHVALSKVSATECLPFEALGETTFECDERGCLVINAPQFSTKRYVTNDIVKLVDPGRFYWLGRIDNVINTGGIKVFPEEIEAKLATIIPHTRFFITSRQSDKWGEEIVLALEYPALPAGKIKEGEIKPDFVERMKKILPAYAVPRRYAAIGKFKETNSGKVIRSI